MIKMVRGVFGLPVNGIVKAIDKDYGPFEAGAEQEARLIRLGLAVRVEDGEPAPVDDPVEDDILVDDPIGFDETPPEDFDDADAEDEAEIVEEIIDLKTLSAKELRALGKDYGLTFKVGMTKEEMAAAIEAAQAEEAEGEDGEPAPEFDAAEAVL